MIFNERLLKKLKEEHKCFALKNLKEYWYIKYISEEDKIYRVWVDGIPRKVLSQKELLSLPKKNWIMVDDTPYSNLVYVDTYWDVYKTTDAFNIVPDAQWGQFIIDHPLNKEYTYINVLRHSSKAYIMTIDWKTNEWIAVDECGKIIDMPYLMHMEHGNSLDVFYQKEFKKNPLKYMGLYWKTDSLYELPIPFMYFVTLKEYGYLVLNVVSYKLPFFALNKEWYKFAPEGTRIDTNKCVLIANKEGCNWLSPESPFHPLSEVWYESVTTLDNKYGIAFVKDKEKGWNWVYKGHLETPESKIWYDDILFNGISCNADIEKIDFYGEIVLIKDNVKYVVGQDILTNIKLPLD